MTSVFVLARTIGKIKVIPDRKMAKWKTDICPNGLNKTGEKLSKKSRSWLVQQITPCKPWTPEHKMIVKWGKFAPFRINQQTKNKLGFATYLKWCNWDLSLIIFKRRGQMGFIIKEKINRYGLLWYCSTYYRRVDVITPFAEHRQVREWQLLKVDGQNTAF